MPYSSIDELKVETGLDEFDAIFEVAKEFTLVFAGLPDEDEYRLHNKSLYLGPHPSVYKLQLGVYGARGWGEQEDPELYGSDDYLSLDRDDVDSLVEQGYIKYLQAPD